MDSAVRQAFRSETSGSVWAAYRRRAQKLNASTPNPVLAKYLEIVSIQDELHSLLMDTCDAPNASGHAIVSFFNDAALQPLLAKARSSVAAIGLTVGDIESAKSLHSLWHQTEVFDYPADFPARLVLEVFATEVSAWPHRQIETRPDRCPHCGFPVMCSVLRELGSGRARAAACSLCAGEWSAPRLGCLRCDEQKSANLPLFTFEEFPHIRIEACDSCGGWLKSIDLATDGEAIPTPDDVFSSALNIWASGQGYQPIGSHLFSL